MGDVVSFPKTIDSAPIRAWIIEACNSAGLSAESAELVVADFRRFHESVFSDSVLTIPGALGLTGEQAAGVCGAFREFYQNKFYLASLVMRDLLIQLHGRPG